MDTENTDMNMLVDRYPEIEQYARQYGLPIQKKRAIIREFLQMQFLDSLYRVSSSAGLAFVGGTSLRIIRGINRFSEDLDFDRTNISIEGMNTLVESVVGELRQTGIALNLYKNKTNTNTFFELRYPDILKELEISTNQTEKLAIKLDNAPLWKGEKTETLLVSRFGYLQHIVTIPLAQILVQKILAYVSRRQTMARDIYDICWLRLQGVVPDYPFLFMNAKKTILQDALDKFQKEVNVLKKQKERLAPFLLDESKVVMLDMFVDLMRALKQK